MKHSKFIKEFILECSNEDVRKIVSTLIRKTFAECLNFEKHILITPQPHINNASNEAIQVENAQQNSDGQEISESKAPLADTDNDNSYIMNAIENSEIGKFLDFLLSSLKGFRPHYRNIHIHFQNIYRFIKESPYIGEYLLRKGLIMTFIKYLLFEDEEEESAASNDDSKLDVEEEENAEPDNEITKNYNGWGNKNYATDDLLKANMLYFWKIIAYLVHRASKFYDQTLDAINYTIP